MLPRGCCCCCKDENEMAPRDRFEDDASSARDGGSPVGCADFCGSSRMSEGRQSQVVLLDDRRLDILIKPKLYAGELLDMVASHFNLKEKEYFGIAYADDTGHYSWLQLDRRVLEHEFPKKSSQVTLVLYFRIKYFVESITHLRDSSTVEAFYLQTQSLVYNGVIEVSSDKAFQLAALVLQTTHGDYTGADTAKQQLKKLPVLPTSTLVEHPSLTICEDRVIEEYKCLKGQTRGSAIVNYMRIAESLPTYGVHYYEVKDKAGIPWWLGISYKGICQYDLTDRKVPRKLFLWKQLENLYFRDRKFSIEVYDPKRVTASRKTFGSGNICVHVWFASSPSLTKCIWSMAIAQHQFYLDRKHNKSSLSLSRNFSDIADELSHGSYSTETSSLDRSISSLSLPALKIDSDSCDETLDTAEMFVALKARREALEESLHRKSEELKKLCIQEGELTGTLPPEMPLSPGEQIPLIQKKIGASFSFKDKLLWKKRSKDEEELATLELEYEIQSKIVNAAFKLTTDSSVKKNIRKQRKMSHQKAVSKLKEIEQKLMHFKTNMEILRSHQKHHSDEEQSEDNISHITDENEKLIQRKKADLMDFTIEFSPTDSEKDAKNFHKMSTSSSSPVPLPSIMRTANSSSVPSSPSNARHITTSQVQNTAEKENVIKPELTLQGYTPSSVYQTQTSYRSQQYPTFSMRSPSSQSSGSGTDYGEVQGYCDRPTTIPALSPPYQNRFESTLNIEGSNLYSVPTQRTSQAFDSQDDILASITINPHDLGLMSRHNSLDRNKRQSLQRYRRYMLEISQAANDAQTQSMYTQYKDQGVVIPYQSHQVPYSSHHPHHFHHHRHREEKDFSKAHLNHSSTCNDLHSLQNANMYQKNLKLYAADAMIIGDTRYRQQYPNASLFSMETKSKASSISPYDSGLSSPSSTIDKHWRSSQQSVPSSNSMIDMHKHLNTSHPGSKVDIITPGHFQPYWEETKPYETSDFYKYSTKHRKQHQAASQNLHAKLSAWKANQASSQYLSAMQPVMSPVMERSRTTTTVCELAGSRQESLLSKENSGPTNEARKDGNKHYQSDTQVGQKEQSGSDAFHDGVLEWLTKQERGKKITLV